MKAVVWTDAFQSVLMVGGQCAIIIIGCVKVGGFDKMWNINQDWGRLHVELSADPTVRMTLWGSVIGGCFLGMYIILSPT